MATKKLRSQVLDNLHDLVWEIFTLGISMYCVIQIFLNKSISGKQSESKETPQGLKWFLYWLEDTGHKNILLIIFGIITLIFICLIIGDFVYLTPKRSVLGRSILTQASSYEMFSDLVHNIDTDLAMEAKKFGTELVVGTHWMLSDQAMRIKNIERVYIGEQKIERKKCSILLAADKKGNLMKTVFFWDRDRDEALEYLRRRIPELYVGDLKEAQ